MPRFIKLTPTSAVRIDTIYAVNVADYTAAYGDPIKERVLVEYSPTSDRSHVSTTVVYCDSRLERDELAARIISELMRNRH